MSYEKALSLISGGGKTHNIVRKNNKLVIEAPAGELNAGDVCIRSLETAQGIEKDAQIVLYSDSSDSVFFAVTIYVNIDSLDMQPFEAMQWEYSAEDGGYIIATGEDS